MTLQLIYRPVEALKPHPNNARVHPKKQIAQIAASIRSAEFVNPILIDEDDVIIAGHGRLLAAKQLDMTTVPTIQISHLTAVEKTALRLADNKIAQNAAWDPELLRIELASIELEGFDIELTGFSIGEIDTLRSDGDVDDDQVPALAGPPVTKLGDVWCLGPHRIACGDVRDAELLRRLMDGVQVLAG